MLLPHGLASNQTLADPGSHDVNSGSNHNTVLLNLFLSLQLISLVGLVLVLATVLLSGKTTKRHPIWMNFMICWVVSCVSYSFMVGHSVTWEPPHALCFVQAVMIYTVPSLTAGATLALLVHVLIFFRITFTFPEAAHTRPQAIWYILLITVPHIPALGMFFLSLGIGLKDPGTVKRTESGMYCNMENEYPGKLSAIIVTVFMLGSIVVEILIFLHLRRNRDAMNRNDMFIHMRGTAVRVLAFSGGTVLAAGLGIVFFAIENSRPGLNIVIALIPLSATLVFGSQEDILRSWVTGFGHLRKLPSFISRSANPDQRSPQRVTINMQALTQSEIRTGNTSLSPMETTQSHSRVSHLSKTSLHFGH